jgi:hypothetical protein
MKRTAISTLSVAAALLLTAATALADEPDGAAALQQNPAPDFLFGRPKINVGLRGAFTFGRARSDWYEFVTDQLTLDRNDFRSAGLAGEVGLAINPRLEVVFGADFSRLAADSEFRHWLDNNRLPISQTTTIRQATLSIGARLALMDRGRELSSLAWVPRRVVPYVGAGAGTLWYKVVQTGDFVDFQDLSIFYDILESTGRTPMAYVHGGADLHLVRMVYATFDVRYQWAAPDLNTPWTGFEPLDMAGARISTGINLAF